MEGFAAKPSPSGGLFCRRFCGQFHGLFHGLFRSRWPGLALFNPHPISLVTMNQRHIWHELDLLCRIGVGLAPIAPDLTALLRRMVGADAAALFWLDEFGLPEGFHHEDSPDSVKDLFLNEFERLFVGEREINVLALSQRKDRCVGHLLAPGADYFQSNTYNLLVRASGHHHSLDLRVDVNGRARAVVLLFRTAQRPFADEEAAALLRAAPYLQRAIEISLPPDAWQGLGSQHGHLLLDGTAQRIVLMNDPALDLLRNAGQRGMGWREGIPPKTPPPWVQRLLAQPDRPLHLPVPGGVLVAQVHPMHAPSPAMAGPGGGAPPHLLVALSLKRPMRMDVVRRVLALQLSPLQREIALLAGLGHARADCVSRIGVSPEALKKHLRAIFTVTATRDWDDLARALSS